MERRSRIAFQLNRIEIRKELTRNERSRGSETGDDDHGQSLNMFMSSAFECRFYLTSRIIFICRENAPFR